MGIDYSDLWRLENGKQRPSLDMAILLEKRCGIPTIAWDLDQEEAA